MELDRFLLYLTVTILIETPVLLVGLSRRHPWRRRLFAGVWLNACSYPIVFFVLPELIDIGEQRVLYLTVAEIFAPVSECVLFYCAFSRRPAPTTAFESTAAAKPIVNAGAAETWQPYEPAELVRDCAAIIVANLLSFIPVELAYRAGWTLLS